MADTVICKQIGAKIGDNMANLIFQFSGNKQIWDQRSEWRHEIENGLGYSAWYKGLYEITGGKGFQLTHEVMGGHWLGWTIKLPLTEDNLYWAWREKAPVRWKGGQNKFYHISHFYNRIKQVNLRTKHKRDKVSKTTLGIDELYIEYQRGISRHETLEEIQDTIRNVEAIYGASTKPQ